MSQLAERQGCPGRGGERSGCLSLYLHTIRHLRIIQVLARARSLLVNPAPALAPAPALGQCRAGFVAPIERAPELIAPNLFRFEQLAREFGQAQGWYPSGVSKLWLYHLHYFDDLNAQQAMARSPWHTALLRDWVRENPPQGLPGWDPYPVSRRIINWIKWALRGNSLPSVCVDSLAVQARWLRRRLEYHLLGNHLLTNAKALVYAGYYFSGEEARRWRSKGLGILRQQLPEQLLQDGGHFELSPMYQAAVLEDLLDLVNLLQTYGEQPPSPWPEAIERMRGWLSVMTHPDGEIAFFNDAAFGEAPRLSQLDSYAERLGLQLACRAHRELTVLEDSGYVRAEQGPACLICDCASVGAEYLPGHAHADTLSFELSLFGQRVLVNSGTSQYGAGAERERQRSTRAHNTVVVNRQDSSEVWASFRVARRARACLHQASSVAECCTIDASHDGYQRLAGKNEHRRRWQLTPQMLQIEDRLSGVFASAEAYFHLHPDIEARITDGERVLLTCPAGQILQMVFAGAHTIELESGSWHPRFGSAVPNRHVVARFSGSSLRTTLSWR